MCGVWHACLLNSAGCVLIWLATRKFTIIEGWGGGGNDPDRRCGYTNSMGLALVERMPVQRR
jgi:hypothetical protein